MGLTLADLKNLATCNGWVLCDTGAAAPGIKIEAKPETTVTRAKLAGDAFLTKLTVAAQSADYAVGDVVYVLAREFLEFGKSDNLLTVEGKKLVFVPAAAIRLKSARLEVAANPWSFVPHSSCLGPNSDFILTTTPAVQILPCGPIPPATTAA